MNNINELLACYVGATPEEQLKDLGKKEKTSVRAGKWAWSPRRVAGSLWRTFANGTKMVFNSEARRLLLEKDVNRENYNSLLPVLEAKLGSVHDLSRKDPFFTAETFYETVGLERTLTSNPLGAILIGDEQTPRQLHAARNKQLDLILIAANRLGYFTENPELECEANSADLRDYLQHRKSEAGDASEGHVEEHWEDLIRERSDFLRKGWHVDLVKKLPDDQEGYILIAQERERNGNLVGAIESYTGVLKRFAGRFTKVEDEVEVLDKLGELHYTLGQLNSAGAAKREMVRIAPQSNQARAYDNTMRKLFDEAVMQLGVARKGGKSTFSKVIEKAMRLDHTRGDFRWLKARWHLAMGRTSEAVNEYTSAVSTRNFWSSERYTSSIAMRDALLEGPFGIQNVVSDGFTHSEVERLERMSVHLLAGRTATGRKDWKAARSAYDRALKVDGSNLEAHLGVAHAWEATARTRSGDGRKKAYVSAIVRYKRILGSVDTTCVDAMYSIGKNYEVLGKPELAAKRFRDVLELQPDHVAKSNLKKVVTKPYDAAVVAYNKGQYRKALGSSATALKYNPHCADAHRLQGMALQKLGKKNAAIKAYINAVSDENTFWKENSEKRKANSYSRLRKLMVENIKRKRRQT